jgi:hypothetical protein
MTLGDRCDEIVRLIDETLLSVGVDLDAVDTSRHPSGTGLVERARRPLELVVPTRRAPLGAEPA